MASFSEAGAMTGYLGTLAADAKARFDTILINGVAIPLVTDNVSQPDPQATYAVMTVMPDDHQNATMGSPIRYRVTGDVLIDILVPAASGEDTIQLMADEITEKFLGVRVIVDGYHIKYSPAPTFSGLPIREDAHWFRSMRLPFQIDYFR
jgi:hypothetical protein